MTGDLATLSSSPQVQSMNRGDLFSVSMACRYQPIDLRDQMEIDRSAWVRSQQADR
jgi:hypothetical protein